MANEFGDRFLAAARETVALARKEWNQKLGNMIYFAGRKAVMNLPKSLATGAAAAVPIVGSLAKTVVEKLLAKERADRLKKKAEAYKAKLKIERDTGSDAAVLKSLAEATHMEVKQLRMLADKVDENMVKHKQMADELVPVFGQFARTLAVNEAPASDLSWKVGLAIAQREHYELKLLDMIAMGEAYLALLKEYYGRMHANTTEMELAFVEVMGALQPTIEADLKQREMLNKIAKEKEAWWKEWKLPKECKGKPKDLGELRAHQVWKLTQWYGEGRFELMAASTDGGPVLLISSAPAKEIDADYIAMATPKAARPWITGTYKSKKGEKYEFIPKEITAKHVTTNQEAALVAQALKTFCPPTTKAVFLAGKPVDDWFTDFTLL